MAKEKRLYHVVADQIRGMINNGTYPPGSRLPGERELAARFDVSRVTVREAEIALQALGHLSIKTGSGVYVLEPPAAPNGGLPMPMVSAFELTEARLLFESEAAALAARAISDTALDRLHELVETMGMEDGEDDVSQRADREFHLTIAAESRNAVVQFVIETLWQIRTENHAVKEVHAAVCANETAADRGAEHEEVLAALRNRDPLAARRAMQKHFTRLLTSMIDVTEEKAVEELRRKAMASRQRYLNDVAQHRTG